MSRSTAKRALFGFGAIGAAAVAYYAHRAWVRHQHLVEVAQAYAEFHACLYGEPLAVDEKGSDRLRAIALCALPPSDWPKNCSPSLIPAMRAFDALEIGEEDPVYGELRKNT